MKCPVCGAIYRPPAPNCKRCKADLTDLIKIHDQALWFYRKAIAYCLAQDYTQAQIANDRAIALHANNPDFHALAGQIAALSGNFVQAVQHWQRTLKLQPAHARATTCLHYLEQARALAQSLPH